MRKEINSQRILLVHQHGRRFIVLEHQYGRRDVMWKRSIIANNEETGRIYTNDCGDHGQLTKINQQA